MDPYEPFCRERGLRWPAGLSRRLARFQRTPYADLIYWPQLGKGSPNSLHHGLDLLDSAVDPPPDNLLPIAPLDDRSIACATCVREEDWSPDKLEPGPALCEVVRWHLDVVPEAEQGALIDDDAGDFAESFIAELHDRPEAMRRMLGAAQTYLSSYVQAERTPRSHVLRPVQLACQNVIVGMATLRQDASFDGLRVEDFASCEVPHLAAHEGVRALTALILCDAFRNGGTMEVRFGPSRSERRVPESLRRYGRARNLSIGSEDPCALTPAESRRLFLACTPMPDDLAERCAALFDQGAISPERICYTIMSGTWGAIELDFLSATSSRLLSILSGGAEAFYRRNRLPELESSRAAIMIGMLWRRLSLPDEPKDGAGTTKVFEDAAASVAWRALEDEGAVMFGGSIGGIPWWGGREAPPSLMPGRLLIALPRATPSPFDLELVQDLAGRFPDALVAMLVPNDMADTMPDSVPHLVCPDALAALDVGARSRMHAMKVGRS